MKILQLLLANLFCFMAYSGITQDDLPNKKFLEPRNIKLLRSLAKGESGTAIQKMKDRQQKNKQHKLTLPISSTPLERLIYAVHQQTSSHFGPDQDAFWQKLEESLNNLSIEDVSENANQQFKSENEIMKLIASQLLTQEWKENFSSFEPKVRQFMVGSDDECGKIEAIEWQEGFSAFREIQKLNQHILTKPLYHLLRKPAQITDRVLTRLGFSIPKMLTNIEGSEYNKLLLIKKKFEALKNDPEQLENYNRQLLEDEKIDYLKLLQGDCDSWGEFKKKCLAKDHPYRDPLFSEALKGHEFTFSNNGVQIKSALWEALHHPKKISFIVSTPYNQSAQRSMLQEALHRCQNDNNHPATKITSGKGGGLVNNIKTFVSRYTENGHDDIVNGTFGRCEIKTSTDHYGARNYQVKVFSNVKKDKTVVEYTISTDPRVVEIQGRPQSSKTTFMNRSTMERFIFSAAKTSGITAKDNPGGGHIHLDVRGHFSSKKSKKWDIDKTSPEETLLMRNFMVDLQNNGQIYASIFGSGYYDMNDGFVAQKDKKVQEAFLAALKKHDEMPENKKSIGTFAVLVHNAFIVNDMGAKFHSVNVERMVNEEKFKGKETIELRFVRAQKDPKEYQKELDFFSARINYLKQFKEPIPLKLDAKHKSPKHQVVEFCQLLQQANLSYDHYRSLMPRPLAKIPVDPNNCTLSH